MLQAMHQNCSHFIGACLAAILSVCLSQGALQLCRRQQYCSCSSSHRLRTAKQDTAQVLGYGTAVAVLSRLLGILLTNCFAACLGFDALQAAAVRSTPGH